MSAGTGHLAAPPDSPAGQALFEEDMQDLGFVMNASRLWAYRPDLVTALFGLMRQTLSGQGLSHRQVGVIVAASAAARGDSYCALAWGTKLAAAAGDTVAAGVLTGDDNASPAADQALAAWVRRVVLEPNATTTADVDAMRAAGWNDAQVFTVTVFAALRMAFSTVNAGLGVGPDAGVGDRAPAAVREAVHFGRPVSGGG